MMLLDALRHLFHAAEEEMPPELEQAKRERDHILNRLTEIEADTVRRKRHRADMGYSEST